MTIAFNSISSTNRVPGGQIEIDGSQARTGSTLEPHHVLLIGTRLSTGSATQGQIKSITGALTGDAYFGAKSMLGEMCRTFKRVNRTARLSAMAMDEASGGNAASGSLPYTGTATETATLILRIADYRITVAVTSGDTATVVATAVDTAINAKERLPVSSTRATATLTPLCRHKGEAGNAITMEHEYLPAGLGCTITQLTGGATNPTASTAIAALADERYDTIVIGYSDATTVAAFEVEAARRWGPTIKQPCMIFAGARGAHGALTTLGAARNSQYSTIIGSGLSPTVPWTWAAQTAARDAQRCDTQPNRPRNGLTLPDCEAPKVTERFDHDERNLLLFDGISTFKVDQSGTVMIERLITTYQTDANSQSDKTYLSIETQRNLADLYIRVQQLASKYGDYMVAPDGTNVDAGVPVLTPSGWRGEVVAWYDDMIRAGRVKDAEGFNEDLLVEINEDDPERLDSELPFRLVNGLVTMAIKVPFQL